MKEKVTPELQARRLAAVINRIIENPESWKQEEYHCGSAHCFAGHADILAGFWIDHRLSPYVTLTTPVLHGWLISCETIEERVALVTSCSLRAERWLGLTKQESMWLFFGSRTFRELYEFVAYKVRNCREERRVEAGLNTIIAVENLVRMRMKMAIERDGDIRIVPVGEYPPIEAPGGGEI